MDIAQSLLPDVSHTRLLILFQAIVSLKGWSRPEANFLCHVGQYWGVPGAKNLAISNILWTALSVKEPRMILAKTFMIHGKTNVRGEPVHYKYFIFQLLIFMKVEKGYN